MKLAISNIAWDRHDDPAVLALLREGGVTGIEVAPTKVWPDWHGATAPAGEAYRRQLADQGFAVPALQAIVYGKPALRLFDPDAHAALVEHLTLVADLAAGLGAKVLVFGAPKNRRRGQLSMAAAMRMAADVLAVAAEVCDERGVCLGLEPNPAEYTCDFVTNVADARELVDRVASPGLQMHVDSAAVHLGGGDIAATIRAARPFVHYHASEPMLAPLAGGVVDHATAMATLQEIGYAGWISLEMKPHAADPAWIADCLAALHNARHP